MVSLAVVVPPAPESEAPYPPTVGLESIAALIASLVSTELGVIVALPAWALGAVMLWTIRVLGSVEFALIEPLYSQLLSVIVGVICVALIVKLRSYD